MRSRAFTDLSGDREKNFADRMRRMATPPFCQGFRDWCRGGEACSIGDALPTLQTRHRAEHVADFVCSRQIITTPAQHGVPVEAVDLR
jgi:hypothetical protein